MQQIIIAVEKWYLTTSNAEGAVSNDSLWLCLSVCFGSCGTCTSMAADPSVTVSLQATDAKYLLPAAKMRMGHLPFCDTHCIYNKVKYSPTEI